MRIALVLIFTAALYAQGPIPSDVAGPGPTGSKVTGPGNGAGIGPSGVLPADGSNCCTFFVSQSTGSDSNPGTIALPWQTIAKVNAATLAAGNSVGFKAGDTWRETLTPGQSGTSGSPITYTSYGSGAQPIISGSDLKVSGWTKQSTDVWKTTASTQPNIVYFNGSRGTSVASIAAIIAPLEYFWSSSVLYVWAPGDVDPSTTYTSPGIEAGARDRVIDTDDQSYLTFSGMDARDGNGLGDSEFNVGSNSVVGVLISKCTVERGASAGINIKGAVTAASVSIDGCTIQNNGQWGILVSDAYTTGIVSNNSILNNGWATTRDAQEFSGVEGSLANFQIFGNTISGNGGPGLSGDNQCHGIYLSESATPATIYNNLISGQLHGSGIKVKNSAIIYSNTITGNSAAGIAIAATGTTANGATRIYNNTIYGNLGGLSGIVEQNLGSGTMSISIEANTLYQNAGSGQQEVQIVNNITALTVLNNLMFTTPTRRTYAMATQTGIVSIDYNLQWRADGNPNISVNGSNVTWAAWQGLGFDTHGLNLNPLLVDPASGNFNLQPGSPAIGAGVFIPGVSTANPPNIGAK